MRGVSIIILYDKKATTKVDTLNFVRHGLCNGTQRMVSGVTIMLL